MKRKKSAVAHLVRVTNQQLGENKIDTDASRDMHAEYHLFEAFFSVPSIKNVVVHIFTNGLPEVPDDHRLFLDIYYKSTKGIRNLVAIHTAKFPEQINEQDALNLSDNTPEQLLKIAEIIQSAAPIDRNKYFSFFEGQSVPVKKRSL